MGKIKPPICLGRDFRLNSLGKGEFVTLVSKTTHCFGSEREGLASVRRGACSRKAPGEWLCATPSLVA